MAAYFAARAAYQRQHRRLLSVVREFLPGEVVEDVAVGVRWSSAWPTLLGIAALAIGAIFASLDRILPVLAGLVLGFGLLAIGWVATPALLLVSSADEVLVIEGRVERTSQSPSWNGTIGLRGCPNAKSQPDGSGSARSGNVTCRDADSYSPVDADSELLSTPSTSAAFGAGGAMG